MKRLTILFVLFIMACTSQSVPSTAQQGQITIINKTGFPVWYIYISLSTDDDWGPDLMNVDQIIVNNDFINLYLPDPESEQYDIMLEDSVGNIYIKYKVRLTTRSRIVFTFDDIW